MALINRNILLKPYIFFAIFSRFGESFGMMGIDDNIPQYKVVLVGDSGVGKSSILDRLNGKNFDEKRTRTLGVDLGVKRYTIKGENISIKLWDTSGQEKFEPEIYKIFNNVSVFVIVYDVTNKESSNNITPRIKAARLQSEGATFFLVGNKTDLKNTKEQIFTNEKGIKNYEVSAKTGEGIDKLFEDIANECYEKHIPDTTEKKCSCFSFLCSLVTCDYCKKAKKDLETLVEAETHNA